MIIRGVPEPFNYPWLYAIEQGYFNAFDLQWQDEPSGTGALCQSFCEGKIELAISLTDATLMQISKGTPCTIVNFFVLSPLKWSIHTCASRPENKIEDFAQPKYAISRLGSGSQTMAVMEARKRGMHVPDSNWVVTHTMEESIESLQKKKTDVFFWEKYITAPYVRQGHVKRIGEIQTKWPSFVLTVHDDFFKNHSEQLNQIQKIIGQTCRELSEDPTLAQKISSQYNMHMDDAHQWVREIQWNPCLF
jgi:ABC-type nitrate/sulfonate/bicarbonate transport system substrate-binding protein